MSFSVSLQQFDVMLLNIFRWFINQDSGIQVSLIHIFADIELIVCAFFLVFLWFYGLAQKEIFYKEQSLKIFFSIVISIVFCILLNNILPFRPRPEVMSTILPLISHIPDNSFPSMHAMFAGSSTFAAFLFLQSPQKKYSWFKYFIHMWMPWVLWVLWILMAFSRVLAWIHYPGDIMVGYLLSIILTYMTAPVFQYQCVKKYFLQFLIRLASFLHL